MVEVVLLDVRFNEANAMWPGWQTEIELTLTASIPINHPIESHAIDPFSLATIGMIQRR